MFVLAVAGVVFYKKTDTVTLPSEQKISEENAAVADERIEQAVQSEIPSIIISETEAKPGEKVTVTAEIVNNPGILGMALTLSYDDSVMELLDVKSGEAFEDILDMSHSEKLDNGCIFLWDGEKIMPEQIKDGIILTMEFQVHKEAEAAKSPITLIYDDAGIVDNDLQPIELVIENGSVLVNDQ